jgi:hypothetical protein
MAMELKSSVELQESVLLTSKGILKFYLQCFYHIKTLTVNLFKETLMPQKCLNGSENKSIGRYTDFLSSTFKVCKLKNKIKLIIKILKQIIHGAPCWSGDAV